MAEFELLSTVALLEDLPAAALRRGQVGAIVEQLAPAVFEVEFVNGEGRTYAPLPVPASKLLVLRHEPGHQAA